MRALNIVRIESILFLDIETAPNWLTLEEAPENVQREWIYKHKFKKEAPVPARTIEQIEEGGNDGADIMEYAAYEKHLFEWCGALWQREAALNAEFSRVVCISTGFMFQGEFYLQSYFDQNEGTLLNKFNEDLRAFRGTRQMTVLCAHYGKGFDFVFLPKRMLINRIVLPPEFDLGGLKPWEIPHLDTQELWKFGSLTSTGLPALCMAFGLPTPKNDLDGSKVAAAWLRGEGRRVADYCEEDVFALLNVVKAMRLEEPVSRDKVIKR